MKKSGLKATFGLVVFKLKLAINLSMFLVWLAILGFFEAFKQRRSFLVATSLVLLVVATLTIKIYVFNQFNQKFSVAGNQPTNTFLLEEKMLTKAQIEAELERQKAILQQQPTHFEALLNTSLLYEYLGDSELANQYRRQATIVKPNSPLL